MSQDKRFAYKLNDVNSIPSDSLVPREILLDYSNNDIIIINDDGSKSSLLATIEDMLKNYLPKNHIESDGGHDIVDKDNNGFMTSEMLEELNNNCDLSDNIFNTILGTIENSEVNVEKIDYNLISSLEDGDVYNSIDLSVILNHEGFKTTLNNININLIERPTRDYINLSKNTGIRQDVLLLKILKKSIGYEPTLLTDVIYSDNTIIINDSDVLIYDKYKYIYTIMNGDDEEKYIPLLLFNRKNNDFISIDNPNGKLTDSFIDSEEIIDISRHRINDISLQKFLKSNIEDIQNGSLYSDESLCTLQTNLDYENLNSGLLFVPFNKNDNDYLSNQSLSKNSFYKRSPYGYMLSGSADIGNYISFNEVYDFVLDFIIDTYSVTNNICNECIIKLTDSLLNSLFEIKVVKDGIISINDNDVILPDDQFVSINIRKISKYIFVYLNTKYYGKFETSVSGNIRMLSVPTTHVSIGRLLLTSDTEYINNTISNTNYLIEPINNTSNNDIIVYHKETISVANPNSENVYGAFNLLSQNDKISIGDSVYVAFNNEITDIEFIYPVKIKNINGNKIIIDAEADEYNTILENSYIKFKIGDDVKLQNYKVIGIRDIGSEREIIVDNKIPYEYNTELTTINNIEYSKPIKVYNGTNELSNIITDTDYFKIVFTEEMPLDTEFTIEFLEVISTNKNIMNGVTDILSADINNNRTKKISSNLLKSAIMGTINFSIDGNDLGFINEPIFIKNNKGFTLNCDIDLTKLIPVNIPIEILQKIINVNVDIEASAISGSIKISDCSNLNREEYILTNNIVAIHNSSIVSIDENLIAHFSLTPLDSDSLFIKNITVNITHIGNESYQLYTDDKITDFIITGDVIIVNSTKPTTLYTIKSSNKIYANDNKFEQITEDIDGYVLTRDTNNILCIKDINTNRVYYPCNKYII